MIINAWVYQIFLSRIDWADESKRAWRRVGCKISVSQRPYQSDIAKSSLEYTEKSGILRRVILTCSLSPAYEGRLLFSRMSCLCTGGGGGEEGRGV